jgi:hypothetical protein
MKTKLIGNTLAAASVMAMTACAPAEPPASREYYAVELAYLPDATTHDRENDCKVDMRYIINPETGKITDITDPNLYPPKKDDLGNLNNDFCTRNTIFAPHSPAAYTSATERQAYHTFQAEASKLLERGTWPVNASEEHYEFSSHGPSVVAIGRIGLDKDRKHLQAQLFNGADGTPIAATECVILPSMHGKDGVFAAATRVLGIAMYRGETDTPYALVQLGSDLQSLPTLETDPPLINGYCEQGAVVAVPAEVSASA